MKRFDRKSGQAGGFTMVEMLIAIFIGMIVIALIVTAYWSQTRTSRNQQMTVEMQQNIRSGLFFMQRDIVMAGFSDDPSNPSGGTITGATATSVTFTFADPVCDEDNIDNDADGDIDETLEKDGIDNNGDGDIDEINELETIRFSLSGNQLLRELIEANTNNVRQSETIATDIEELEFFYSLDNGNVGTAFASQDNRNRISKIGISILARTESNVMGYTDRQVYRPLSFASTGVEWGPYDDHIRRELVTTTILCRNMVR